MAMDKEKDGPWQSLNIGETPFACASTQPAWFPAFLSYRIFSPAVGKSPDNSCAGSRGFRLRPAGGDGSPMPVRKEKGH
jgi:hypothetical protein